MKMIILVNIVTCKYLNTFLFYLERLSNILYFYVKMSVPIFT